MNSNPTTGTQSIDRAADLLARVVRADQPPTFTDLADATGLARSTTSRILAALERADLIDRAHDGALRPGSLFDLYAALGVGRGDTVQQIAQVDSTYFLGSRDWVGVEVPAHCSALGKVLYAARVLRVPTGALEQVTDATISTGAALNAALPGIRDLGYAITVDELELGLTGIAAPVSRDGIVIAALGLSGPTSRLADHLQATGAVVAAHARALSARLSMHDKEGAA